MPTLIARMIPLSTIWFTFVVYMLSKNQIKYITSLHFKKNRDKERIFFVEGDKIVTELLNSSYTIHAIYALDKWVERHSKPLEKGNVAVSITTEVELNKISALTTPHQAFALVAMPDYKIELSALKGKLTLLLDEVKDPGNLGTIIRIADWFGIENIICSENTVDLYNPKVVQATMGSIFRVKTFYHNLVSLLKDINLPVYGATIKGTSIYDASLGKEGFIILGNESEGVKKELMSYVNHALTIPCFANGNDHVESLNVAVAAAIVCSEFKRRK